MPPRRAPCCILLIMVKPKPEQDEKGRFIAGNSGNGGRKPGSRAKLGEAFVADLCADWEKHGIETIARVREQRPHEYLKVVASILPKDLNVNVSPFEHMTDAELEDSIKRLLAGRDELRPKVGDGMKG
jgi:hypothetical protein